MSKDIRYICWRLFIKQNHKHSSLFLEVVVKYGFFYNYARFLFDMTKNAIKLLDDI